MQEYIFNSFVITKDKINEVGNTGVTIPKNCDIKFRLLDDDSEIYFYGYQDEKDGSEENVFAPLDWGMNDSGCTELQQYIDKEWVTV